MRHIEIKNFLESYTKQLSKSKTSNSPTNVKLPKLMQSHSYHNLIIRKIEKLRALHCRNKHNSGEKKVRAELSSLFSIHKVENEFFKKFVKIKTVQKNINNQNNNNNNSHNSLNSFTYNSISKTTVSNICNNNNNSNNSNNNFNNNTLSKSINHNNDNNLNKINNHEKDINTNNNNPNSIISNNNINSNVNNNISNKVNKTSSNTNKIKIIKIKQVENCKNVPEENLKINNEYGFIKKKYHINKNNFNKDIFKLINDDSNCLFFSKNAKTPEIGEADAFSNNDSEKNAN